MISFTKNDHVKQELLVVYYKRNMGNVGDLALGGVHDGSGLCAGNTIFSWMRVGVDFAHKQKVITLIHLAVATPKLW